MSQLLDECRSYVIAQFPDISKADIERKAQELKIKIEQTPDEITRRAMPRSKYIECAKCGKRFRSLKCHLTRKHGWYEHDYRKFTGLPDDIPLVCGELSGRRREVIETTNTTIKDRRLAAA